MSSLKNLAMLGFLALVLVLLPAAGTASLLAPPPIPDIDISSSPNGIVPLPAEVPSLYTNLFDNYTKLIAPNGKPIHVMIQDGVPDNKTVHAREVMRHHLTEVPGSLWGTDKAAVANAMANNSAILALFKNKNSTSTQAANAFFQSDVNAQDLWGTEIILEGSNTYMSNNPQRDATYEEVIHLVHGYGITPAMPSLQQALNQAMNHAVNNNLYDPLSDLPPQDWDEEYLAMGLEAYYGIWAHDPNGNGWAGGNEYAFINREDMEVGDPQLFSIVDGFFQPFWTYTAELVSSFSGTFIMEYRPNLTYTLRSQYLNHVTLTGNNSSSLVGNDRDNVLRGNPSNNTLAGGGGDDVLAGGSGTDTAIFSGSSTQYVATWDLCTLVVTDTGGGNGADRLSGIEFLRFSDGPVSVEVFAPTPFTDLGQALAGTAGDPGLQLCGSLVGGTPFLFDLSSVVPSAASVAIIGLSQLSIPLKGGTLVPAPDLLVPNLFVDGNGDLQIATLWPAGLPPGVSLYFQCWIVDEGASQGFAASNAIWAVIP